MDQKLSSQAIHEVVQAKYGQIAMSVNGNGCCGGDSCCESGLYEVATQHLPQEVTQLSLGCGDPITLAGLQAGQVVLDLGSGAGIDCFLAAEQVGETGYVIGVDMTPAMLEKAERNKVKMGLKQVEFRQGKIEALPVEDSSVDVIISNCVINLSPDKSAVFREAFRVLKPNGKLAVSDMVTQGRFTPEQRADMSAWAGCITGAEDVVDYVKVMEDAGFAGISVQDKAAPQIELAHTISLNTTPRLFSARITAIKPTA